MKNIKKQTGNLFFCIKESMNKLKRLENINSPFYKQAKQIISKYPKRNLTDNDVRILELYMQGIIQNRKLFAQFVANAGLISGIQNMVALIASKNMHYGEAIELSFWNSANLLTYHLVYPMIHNTLVVQSIMGLIYEFSEEVELALDLLQEEISQ